MTAASSSMSSRGRLNREQLHGFGGELGATSGRVRPGWALLLLPTWRYTLGA
ncbi:MAG: hypothetical protein ABI625_06805 [bacterium]